MVRTSICLTTLALLACDPGPMTNAEALEALGEARDSSRGIDTTHEAIEISTEFTIGDAVEQAAETIAAWWQSQQDCTTVTVDGPTTTVDFGDLADACDFRGYHYGGIAKITVESTEMGELRVTHEWLALQTEDTQVDGGATVDWSGNELTRRVVTSHTWTDLNDGTTVDVEGDHTQGYIDPEQLIWGGITMEGERTWFSDSGEWQLDMVGLEIRLQDPVPQAGIFELTNPGGKALTIEFRRLDVATIEATLTGTREPLVFHINQLGIPTEAS